MVNVGKVNIAAILVHHIWNVFGKNLRLVERPQNSSAAAYKVKAYKAKRNLSRKIPSHGALINLQLYYMCFVFSPKSCTKAKYAHTHTQVQDAYSHCTLHVYSIGGSTFQTDTFARNETNVSRYTFSTFKLAGPMGNHVGLEGIKLWETSCPAQFW